MVPAFLPPPLSCRFVGVGLKLPSREGNTMPVHPFEACLNHVIGAGLKNIQRLNDEGRSQDVRVEVEHLIEVQHILNQAILYGGTERYDEAEFERYFHVNRLAYKAKANAVTEDMMHAWDFLAPDKEAFEQQESGPWWEEWRKTHPIVTWEEWRKAHRPEGGRR